MKLDVLTVDGSKSGKQVDLPEDIFGIEPNEHAIYLAVKQYLANQRQGTHKSKERGEVAGSRRKIKRQKGTGTARAGDIKNPIFRGGGRIFGPRPRNYNIRLNKKVKQLARKSALTAKASAGSIIVVEDFTLEAPKTREYSRILNNLSQDSGKTLLVTGEQDNMLYLSSRNLPKSNVSRVQDLSTYEILNSGTLILSEGAIDKLKESFAN
ncbi:MAG: 50S ribosomal protein L4 [Bacteroidota bacterium]